VDTIIVRYIDPWQSTKLLSINECSNITVRKFFGFRHGIPEGKVLHDAGEGNVACLDHQMNMVSHEAEGVDAMAETLDTFLQKKKEAGAVFFGEKDILSGIASQNDMVEGAEIMESGFACHGE
jgi:hypothetical protein